MRSFASSYIVSGWYISGFLVAVMPRSGMGRSSPRGTAAPSGRGRVASGPPTSNVWRRPGGVPYASEVARPASSGSVSSGPDAYAVRSHSAYAATTPSSSTEISAWNVPLA